MCIHTVRITYMHVYSSILFRIIYLLYICFFFPFYLTFHCSGNNSLVHACFAPTSFLKIGYYVGLEDFLHFSKKCTVIILYVNSHQELELLKAFV